MKNILIVSGHNDLTQSFANKLILDKLQQALPNAEFDLLDSRYPNYQIDVTREQEALVKADVIVLQFPIFWYGVPSLMKKWQEEVFVYGFAHGSTGNKLHGKKLLISFTTGAPEEMYQYAGLQNYPIEDFLPPFKQFANLCGMQWVGYVYSGGLSYVSRNDPAALTAMEAKAVAHAEKVINEINQL